MAGFGALLLVMALAATTYSAAACAVGARRSDRRLVASGIQASYLVAALLTFASAVILHAFVAHDYSIKYVQRYSDSTMPLFYKVTAFWGGLDGSLMFWAWLLGLFSAIAIYVNRERHRDLIPWIVTVLGIVMLFFLILLVFFKNPFETFLAGAPADGKGLNPLLQNAYMATHPPSLYIGFVGFTIPFAFGLAALITGNLDDSWLLSVRRWVLVAWLFNSIGLVLGSLWAYEVLGWGGYWGWDPVENAGFLPWLGATAFLHSVMIQERRGMLKKWNLFLVIMTFMLTIVGTMMTRTGIVQSVHAFGEDNQLLVAFLLFLGVIGTVSFGLLVYRLPLLRSRNELETWLCREFAFVVNNWILLVAAIFIFFATMFPTISEKFVGNRITVGPPFFNKWMVPIGLMLLFLTAVGPLIAWRRATADNLKKQFLSPLGFAVVTAGVLFALGMRRPAAIVNFALCAMVTATIVQEFYRGARVRQKTTGLDLLTSLIGLVARGRRRYGGYIVHFGVVMMFVGWGGDAFQAESEVSLKPGQKMRLRDYELRFDRLTPTEDVQKEMITADVTVWKKGKEIAQLRPARWFYKKSQEDNATTQVEIHRALDEDFYVILGGFELQENVANIKVTVNPLVNWIWIGFALLTLGTLLALTPERAYAFAASRVPAGSAARGPLLILFAAVGLLAFGGVARAQGAHELPAPDVVQEQVTPLEKEIGSQIVCMCGTCTRENIADCRCGYAAKERAELKKLLGEGKTPEQILAHFKNKYPGDAALIVPPDTGFNRLAWALPYAVAAGGALFVILIARRITRRPSVEGRGAEAEAKPETKQDDLDAKLDEELRSLD